MVKNVTDYILETEPASEVKSIYDPMIERYRKLEDKLADSTKDVNLNL